MLPVTSCGQCGAQVDARRLQAKYDLVLEKALSRINHHQCLNDNIAKSLSATGMPTTKEPVWLHDQIISRAISPTRCQCGMSLSLALQLSRNMSQQQPGSWRGGRTVRCQQVCNICEANMYTYSFLLIAVETLGPMNLAAFEFFCLKESQDGSKHR